MNRRDFAKSVISAIVCATTATAIGAADRQKEKKLMKIHRRQPDGSWVQVRMRELSKGDIFRHEDHTDKEFEAMGTPYCEDGDWKIQIA